MTPSSSQKVMACHLSRNAYLYIRQSTIRQVFENTESTQRQYALRERAIALGWSSDQIVVIDSDQGQSGASAADREGFQRLVSEVGLGRAGIVLGLEVSRLARNCSDWHRLLEICALSNTLILDEDGLYDPSHFNDRLLLGLKGTMSEAELHVLRARLRGGLLNKAQRGELHFALPVGLVYDARGRVVLDPDQQVQKALQVFFETYDRTGSTMATVKLFHQQGLLFPRRLRRGVHKGKLLWGPLGHNRALQTLHNPRYAGAFVYGRHKLVPSKRNKRPVVLPQDQWQVVLLDFHPGYIRWEQYQANLRRLRECANAYGNDRRKSPPGQGPALLQGLAACGKCGLRMTVRYNYRFGRMTPQYSCQREGIEHGKAFCQLIPGQDIDRAIGKILVELMTPASLEVAMAVQKELQDRLEEADRLRKQQVERARYETELAQHRYMQVDPRNRLVADALEAEWNEKLRDQREVEEQYEQQREADRALLNEESRRRILALTTDFPRLWNDPSVSDQQRKRMVRLLIEDVVLTKSDRIHVHIRFRGGAVRSLSLPLPKTAWELRLTPRETVQEIDRLLNNYTEGEIVEKLNQHGFRPGEAPRFNRTIVAQIRKDYHLKTRYERLRESGNLTQEELAKELKVSPQTVRTWRRYGLLQAYLYNDRNECLYEPPTGEMPKKSQGRKLSERRRFPKVSRRRPNGVQHAT